MEPEFRKLVRDALEHLYDTAYLQVHPLLTQITDDRSVDRTTRAQRLRSLLKDTIEALRPQQGSPSSSREWRSYLALRYHYVQGMSMWQTENELGISLRQLQRELHEGIDAVSQLLWDMRVPPAPPAALPETALSDVQQLQHELSQWTLSREPCHVSDVMQDTLWMLESALGERPPLRIALPPDLRPVLADSTLTRQALFKLARLVSRHAESVDVSATQGEGSVVVVFLGRPSDLSSNNPDWHMAALLIGQQGGTLALHELEGGEKRVVLSLPCANQGRVLVVDDSDAIHRLFERYLAPQHYELVHAYSGQEALRLAADSHPDIIILDVMMPTMDGWQVLRNLCQEAATKDIPVVVCSVLREPELALSLGARAYLKKPVERVDLLATLARLRSPADRAAASPPPAPSDS